MESDPWQIKPFRKSVLRYPVITHLVVSAAYSGVDIKILFMDIMPAAVAEKDDEQKPQTTLPQCVVSLGLHAAKDLCMLLEKELQRHEDQFGEIETSYTSQQNQSK